MNERSIAVSVVSHGHGAMVESLIASLRHCPTVGQIIVTQNIPEPTLVFDCDPRVEVLVNSNPKGFGSNHNAAFRLCNHPFFCPLNPDVELVGDPFAVLAERLLMSPSAALIAPVVVSRDGYIEDSLRRFPSISGLFRKMFMGDFGGYPVAVGDRDFFPEWAAGMFMLFRSSAYRTLGGFDEDFFLYYEDVDICVRAWKSGMPVLACPSVAVTHDARRDSHRRLGYLRLHVTSMIRYFLRYWGRLPKVAGVVR